MSRRRCAPRSGSSWRTGRRPPRCSPARRPPSPTTGRSGGRWPSTWVAPGSRYRRSSAASAPPGVSWRRWPRSSAARWRRCPTSALLAGGDEDLLPAVAAGETTAVLVTPFGAPAPADPAISGDALTGTVTGVADALAADLLLVPTPSGLFAVDAAVARLTPLVSLDQTRALADVTFDASPARLVGPAGPAWDAALATGAALLASEQLGVAQWCLDTTVEYLKTRHQFGRPVGSFQALKHRLAELWVAVTQARAVARYAAGCLADDDPDLPVAVALAQAHCGPVAVRAAEECVQLHGGIGFTWEYPAHLYLKRAKADAIGLGTAERHRAILAELVDLPPARP